MSVHPIVHIEFSAADLEAAGRFYSTVFGWRVVQMPEMHYATFEDGAAGGGFNPLTPESPAGTVLVYIATEDIDATLKQITAQGGKVLQTKTEIAGYGWFGVFADPTGNRVGLYTRRPR
jgi:predicted enzyme related to lactoylglutathione lyase